MATEKGCKTTFKTIDNFTMLFLNPLKTVNSNMSKSIGQKYYSTSILSDEHITNKLQNMDTSDLNRFTRELVVKNLNNITIENNLMIFYMSAYQYKKEENKPLTEKELPNFVNDVHKLYRDYVISYICNYQDTFNLPDILFDK